ncbi:MAG: hypothetical protein ACJ77N_01400 [Chloroflexota bacterium]
MTIATAAVDAPARTPMAVDYQPGVCNIGPAEIARRRRAGHVGVLATVGLLTALVGIGAPPLTRLLLVFPAAVAASGYLQASLRFCAGFGGRGVFNFGSVGDTKQVQDEAARRLDGAKAAQIGVASFVVGALVGVFAVILPA